MVKITSLIAFLATSGTVFAGDKCHPVYPTTIPSPIPTSNYPVTSGYPVTSVSTTSSTTSGYPITSPIPPPDKMEKCKQTASQLGFVNGGLLDNDRKTIFLDLSQAGQAQQTNNPFAKQLRKVDGGFEFALSLAGDDTVTYPNGNYYLDTLDYQVAFQYDVNSKKVTKVSCHYKSMDL